MFSVDAQNKRRGDTFAHHEKSSFSIIIIIIYVFLSLIHLINKPKLSTTTLRMRRKAFVALLESRQQ